METELINYKDILDNLNDNDIEDSDIDNSDNSPTPTNYQLTTFSLNCSINLLDLSNDDKFIRPNFKNLITGLNTDDELISLNGCVENDDETITYYYKGLAILKKKINDAKKEREKEKEKKKGKKKSTTYVKKRKSFSNQVSIKILSGTSTLDIKIFKNFSLRITGSRTIEDGKNGINLLLNKIKKIENNYRNLYLSNDNDNDKNDNDNSNENGNENDNDDENGNKNDNDNSNDENENDNDKNDNDKNGDENRKYYILPIDNLDDIKIMNFKVLMARCKFDANFEMDRIELHKILVKKYKIHSETKDDYRGTLVSYYYNPNRSKDEQDGICHCIPKCSGKNNSIGCCMKVTFAVFRTGRIDLITKGNNYDELLGFGYNFLVNVLRREYNKIKIIKDNEKKIKKTKKTIRIKIKK
jgi:hypothetical protein